MTPPGTWTSTGQDGSPKWGYRPEDEPECEGIDLPNHGTRSKLWGSPRNGDLETGQPRSTEEVPDLDR